MEKPASYSSETTLCSRLTTLDSRLSTSLNCDHEETELPSALVDVVSKVAVKRHGAKVGIWRNQYFPGCNKKNAPVCNQEHRYLLPGFDPANQLLELRLQLKPLPFKNQNFHSTPGIFNLCGFCTDVDLHFSPVFIFHIGG